MKKVAVAARARARRENMIFEEKERKNRELEVKDQRKSATKFSHVLHTYDKVLTSRDGRSRVDR